MEDPTYEPSAEVGQKRKLDAFFVPAPAVETKLTGSAHTRATLAALRPEQLIDVAEALAKRCRALETLLEQARAASVPVPAPSASVNPEQVAAQATKVCEVTVKQIRAQMKWKPSCKKGSAKWGYDGLVPLECYKRVFAAHLKPKELAQLKDVTVKRLTVDEFCTTFGTSRYQLSAPIRYGSLSLTGEHVTCKYDATSGELRLTGSYGL